VGRSAQLEDEWAVRSEVQQRSIQVCPLLRLECSTSHRCIVSETYSGKPNILTWITPDDLFSVKALPCMSV